MEWGVEGENVPHTGNSLKNWGFWVAGGLGVVQELSDWNSEKKGCCMS